MRMQTLIFSLLLSSAALAHPYELTSVPHAAVDQYLVIGTAATGTPENLQGLWWMNGNPLADEVVSFAGTTWEPEVKDGEIVGYTGSLVVYDEGIWSWHDSIAGRWLYASVLAYRLVYVAHFDRDFTYGVVVPTIRPLGILPKVTLPPSLLITFTMTQVNADEFSRDSILLGVPSRYRFRRIVDAAGQRLPAFAEFLAKVEAPNALLPICKNNSKESLPTSCVGA